MSPNPMSLEDVAIQVNDVLVAMQHGTPWEGSSEGSWKEILREWYAAIRSHLKEPRFHTGEQVLRHYVPGYESRCPHCGRLLDEGVGTP